MHEENLRALLQQAAQKLGMSEEELIRAAHDGRLQEAVCSGNPALEKVLRDPAEARRLLHTPRFRKLLEMLGEKRAP